MQTDFTKREAKSICQHIAIKSRIDFLATFYVTSALDPLWITIIIL